MKVWDNSSLKGSPLDKVHRRATITNLTNGLESFIDYLFLEESEDKKYDYMMAENPYTPKQIKRAVSEFMQFRVDKKQVKKFYIPLIISAPKLVSIKLRVIFEDMAVDISMDHKFD